MGKATEHPPIDHELAETVWPTLLEQKELSSTLTDRQFQEQVLAGAGFWNPDISAVDVEETKIPSASGREQLPVLILRPKGGPWPAPVHLLHRQRRQDAAEQPGGPDRLRTSGGG